MKERTENYIFGSEMGVTKNSEEEGFVRPCMCSQLHIQNSVLM